MAARARRIVVGYDGSEASQRALDAAADLVGYGSTLSVVTVPDVASSAREHLGRRQVEARYEERRGTVAEQLVEAARTASADLVVVGGPIGGRVVRTAPCDVLVVR